MRRVVVRGMLARKLRLALTALAIVIGVTFVSGTLVLTDTLHRTFDRVVGNVYQHVSFQIRGKAILGNGNAAALNPTANRAPVPQSLVPAVRRVPGVEDAFGAISGYAQFVSRDGEAIGNGGRDALGFGFDPDTKLSAVQLVAGASPRGPHDVVMDKATATKYHFVVGDRVRVLLPGPTQTFTISGIVTFGGANNLIGTTLAGFRQSTAQQLFNTQGRFDTINILAAPSANPVRLQLQIERLLPANIEVVSGQTAADQLTSAINNALSFISTALLIFAFIALFVGAFTIFNTFSITVGQRTRELALLRIVGASRRQVFGSVLGEAAITGLLAALIGLGLGVAAAVGLEALLKAFGVTLPSAGLVFKLRTVIVALAVGLIVTVLSAALPARRAVRIAPVAALAPHTDDGGGRVRKGRLIGGIVCALIALAATVNGVIRPATLSVGLGAAGLLLALGMVAPLLARPLAGTLGRPLAALGVPARLGRENAMRSPRRTAQTAAALMIGLALVSAVAVLGASLSSSAKQSIDNAIRADYIVSGSGGKFSRSVAASIAQLPGVRTITRAYRGQFELGDSLATLTAASTANLNDTVILRITAGRGAAAMAAGELLLDSTTARSKHLHVGSLVPVKFAQTGSATMRVGGIFKPNALLGSYLTGDRFFLAHYDNPLPGAILIATTPGSTGFQAKLNRALAGYPNLSIKTRAEFERSQQSAVNQLLGLVYVLLALAVLIALIGIVNTLMLSVFERLREIGLLRAVGMLRRQVRVMIRAEAVIIALLGALVGIVLGLGLGVALASSLRDNGVGTIALPIPSLIVFLVLAALLGLAAASWPARRAANLDVLAAIAAE